MGQCGEVVFFTEREHPSPRVLLAQVLRLVGATTIAHAWRTLEEDLGWEAFKRDLDREFQTVEIAEDDIPTEMVAQVIPIEEVPKLYREGVSLRVHFGPNQFGELIEAAINTRIPEPIRGNFRPASPTFVVGFHDIFEYAEHDEGYLFGRAFFSFSLFGYSTPNDWQRFREVIFDVPEIADLQKRLEAIAGPMKRCVHWNI